MARPCSLRLFKGHGHILGSADADGDTAAVVAAQRFDHYRIADALGRPDRIRGFVDQSLLRHRQTQITQQRVGLLLVRGQIDRDVARVTGRRRLDPPLVLAVTKLHQAVAVEPDPRHAAFFRRLHQRAGAGPERAVLRVTDKAVALLRKIPVVVRRPLRSQFRGQQEAEQVDTQAARLAPHLRVLVLVHHGVLARLIWH